MLELLDTAPAIDVSEAEYRRLLGYPRDHVLSERSAELAAWARRWYSEEGRPWVYFKEVELENASGELRLGGESFESTQLRRHLEDTGATRAILAFFSAGAGCEEATQRLWSEGKPDEYFFLEMFGSAVVEHLVARANGMLCDLGERDGLMAVPHYSPGYVGWDVSEQVKLFRLFAARAAKALPEPVEVLSSGMLRPKKSLLGVFGLTPRTGAAFDTARRVPCENCAFSPCQYRRIEYKEPLLRAESMLRHTAPAAPKASTSLTANGAYTVNQRALRKWSAERVQIERLPGGAARARFRFEGTTCSNMGHPLAFDYVVCLAPPADGYIITSAECRPSAGDEGHKRMCAYLSQPEALMRSIAAEKPLLGRPLDDVLGWKRDSVPAGCFCNLASRAHKWGLALEAIHFALVQSERSAAATPDAAA